MDQDDEHMQEWLSAVKLTEKIQGLQDVNPQYNFFSNVSDISDDDKTDTRSYSEDMSSSGDETDDNDFSTIDSNAHYAKIRQRNIAGDRYNSSYEDRYKEKSEDAGKGKLTKEERSLPKWFIDRPFQYSRKVFVISLPGIVLLFLLGGEMFVSIACVGGLVVHLFDNAGVPEKALTVYMVVFVLGVSSVFYMCLPLLWKSVFNLILLLTMTSYTTLTGAWILLTFPAFRLREPELCNLIEVSLFTLYPVTSIILVSWMVVNLTTISIGPYVIMAFGYPVLHSFLLPTSSSFYRAPKGKPEENSIMQPVHAATILLLFSLYIVFVFFLSAIFRGTISYVHTGVESLFILTTNGFLVTILSDKSVLEIYGVPDRYRTYIQYSCACLSIFTFPLVLHLYGHQSTLLLWLPLLMLLHIGFGYFICSKNNQSLVYMFGAGLFCVYTAIFYFLPWTMNYYVLDGVHISLIFGLLYCNVVMTLECVVAYSLFTPEEFGLSLIAQTILAVSTQKILQVGGLLNSSVLICSSVVAVFTYIKLVRWKRVPLEHLEVCISLHMTSIVTGALAVVMTTESFILTDVLYFVLLSLLILQLNKLLWTRKQSDLSVTQVMRQILIVAIVTVFNLPVWLQRTFIVLFGTQPNVSDYLGIFLLLVSAVCWKLSYCCTHKQVKSIAQSGLILALVTMVIQPRTEIKWENVFEWMIVVTVLQLLCIARFLVLLKKSMILLIAASFSVGFPIAFMISELFADKHEAVTVLLLGAVCVVLVAISLLVLLESSQTETQVLSGIGVVVLLVLLFSTLLQFTEMQLSLSFLLILVSSLAISIILKLHSLRNQSLLLTKAGTMTISKLPIVGNIATVVAMVTSAAFSPWSMEYWVPVSSSVLILLQEDHMILKISFRGRHNLSSTLTVVTASTLLYTVYLSGVWTETYWSPWLWAFLECAVSLITLPVFINYWTILWTDAFYISDYYTALVLPWFLILPLVGSSNAAYCSCVSGLTVGVWLMKKRLPLLR